MVYTDRKNDVWENGMFAKGELDWGYGNCIFLIKIENDRAVMISEENRKFKEVEFSVFDNVPFSSITKEEYEELVEKIKDRK